MNADVNSQNHTFNANFIKTIHYVLVSKQNETEYEEERKIFENNLRRTGLFLWELEGTNNKRFIKIFAPKETLLKFCEIMKLRMPLKNFGKMENNLSEQFSLNRRYLFNVDSPDFLKPSIKYMIINFILEKAKYEEKIENDDEEESDDDEDNHGITNLILKGAYLAAFPLHNDNRINELRADFKIFSIKFFKSLPLNNIKNYFGIKVALYFAWLEFYNFMLFIASIVSLVYTIFGLISSRFDRFGYEICNASDSIVMCPQCDKSCDFWTLNSICPETSLMHILDNSATVVFGIFMAVWTKVYLNMWSQHSAEMIYKWGVTNDYFLDNRLPTEQFIKTADSPKQFWKKLPTLVLSYTVVIFWICIVLGVLVGLTFYRISLSASQWLYGDDSKTLQSVIVAVTGAIFDLISILILNEVYNKLAYFLTSQEIHRTQKEFEDSLMWKLYIFWFINYYSTFFYIAFFKGRFIGTPDSYNRVFGFRQEECGPGGCLVDLFIQIAVVMIGDILWNNALEYADPYCRKKVRKFKVNHKEILLNSKQWIRDFTLLHWGSKETSMEYLEMVLQYGLVILFVTAFPLAPLFALINNVFEIRFDAKNLLTNFRRPVAQNVKNIGIWIPIMEMISSIAVITNGCIIAFTTNFIPQTIYHFYPGNKSYIDFTYSRFATKDFEPTSVKNISEIIIDECRYPDYRNPPEHLHKYELSEMYWHILAARLIFVLLFQNVVSFLKTIIQGYIPSTPRKLKTQIITEMSRVQRCIIKHETQRACSQQNNTLNQNML